jgi:uridine kinase
MMHLFLGMGEDMQMNDSLKQSFILDKSELFEKMKLINPVVADWEFYEFVYALDNLIPERGWDEIVLEDTRQVETKINQSEFYVSIPLKPKRNGKFVLDDQVVLLTQMLFKGMLSNLYSADWVLANFYFDLRGFIFFPRTRYFTKEILEHFDNAPYQSFEKKQLSFSSSLEIGYKDFMAANQEIDEAFVNLIEKILRFKKMPILLTLAGPTAAGKTEIVSRLIERFSQLGFSVATVEMDNFYNDKDYRDGRSDVRETVHFELFTQSMQEILNGREINIPRYDFYTAVSSHDPQGQPRPGASCITIKPADIIFLEGNFPFHLPEIAHLIGIKIVYLTDDEIRLKRKWRRDIDLRKKYDPINFVNRYFCTQFPRAHTIYQPLMQQCDMLVDTSAANIWITADFRKKFA